jgi:transposase
MAKPLVLILTPRQRADLEWARDRHPLPYIRERAAALLKIADGQSGRAVALHGLLKKRCPDTIYDWISRFKAEGLKGLFVKPGRGRKPAFFPQHPDADSAREVLLHLVRRDPQQFGEERSRWTLAAIQRVCNWLQARTLSGVWRLLDRLAIHYKRARSYIHSPDPDYLEKLQDVQVCIHRSKGAPQLCVVLFQDELTYYRQPTLAAAYELAGRIQPLARLSYGSNTQQRVAAILDPLTGRVIYRQSSKMGVQALVNFYQQVCAAYSGVGAIYLVQDNWPVHFHPDVLAALRPQDFKWPLHVPPNWPKEPSARARRLNLPLQLVLLPTYASWTNPIEKLWRWLKQDVLHLHRYADRWAELQDKVGAFLSQFAKGSQELLRYVGLTLHSKLYGPILATGAGPPPLRN